jgi:hypothetical protein
MVPAVHGLGEQMAVLAPVIVVLAAKLRISIYPPTTANNTTNTSSWFLENGSFLRIVLTVSVILRIISAFEAVIQPSLETFLL